MTSIVLAATLARVLANAGSPAPDVQDESVLFVLQHHAPGGCATPDAGVPPDAGAPPDAAGATPDAGVPPDAGATPDGGTPCHPGDAVTMIVQPRISVTSNGASFAVFYVTPADPVVAVQDSVFADLDAATGPRTIVHENHVQDSSAGTYCGQPTYGCGYNETTRENEPGSWTPPELGDAGRSDGGSVELQTVGPYDVLRAHPADRTELAQWLDRYDFKYLPDDLDALAPYIGLGYTVVAARVTIDHPTEVKLEPLALTWPGTELRLPVALSAARDPGALITVYVAADGTYHFPGANIAFSGPTSVMPYAYVTRNELYIDTTFPVDDPIATHTSDVNYQETVDTYVTVTDPLVVDCDDSDNLGCCGDCSTRRGVRPDTVGIVLGVLFLLRRKRGR